ncbi:MAG: T9SS type A sorting domain-containing protein [Ferruginibacter sp.]
MKKLYLCIFICTLSCGTLLSQSPHAARLYGMTQFGGTDHRGTIFHYTPEIHAIQVDYEMKVTVKGAVPKCEIVSGNNGKYYGTTTKGGMYEAGVIFQWDSATKVYSEPYNFTGIDGRDARGAMVLYNGKFYGMTNSGGANDAGVIYEWDPATNIYTKKVDMDGLNGSNPDGSLTLAGNKFYGFTHNGGINDKGALFEWDPATNIYTKRYDFADAAGSYPVGKLSAFNNKLYAMTNLGGSNNQGVIYEWDYTNNTYTKKFDFDSIRGQHPLGYLTLYNNKFYGLTFEGGIYETSVGTSFGVLFEWNPATNAFVKKKDLGATDYTGRAPLGSLAVKGTQLWGITTQGASGAGTIFSWSPATNVFKDLYQNFNGGYGLNIFQHKDMYQAPAAVSYEAMFLSGDKFFCTAAEYAGETAGCIYEYWPDSNQIRRSVHMLASDGAYPKGSFNRFGNKLIGITRLGGSNHFGNIFEWDLSTSQYTSKFEFDGYKTGGYPGSTLSWYNGKYYGYRAYKNSMANTGGQWFANRQGSNIFSWDPVSNEFHANDQDQLADPQTTPLTLHNGKFYGTGNGGYWGTLIEYDPATDKTKDRILLEGTNGAFKLYQDLFQECGLTYYNGKFYGMTPSLQYDMKGGIYEWDPVTNIITNKISFNDSTTGVMPLGNLLLVGNVFYGLTSGAAVNSGTLFKWDPATNIFEKKSDLGYINEAQTNIYSPAGTLTYSKGKLYGLGYGIDLPLCLKNSGGRSPNGAAVLPGCVFEFDPATDSITDVKVFDYYGGRPNSGVNPAFTQLLEVIPNAAPVLLSSPAAQNICVNKTDSTTFTINDADLDTMHFKISSNNTALLPLTNIAVTNTGNLYTITYFGNANQTGTTTISLTANDGYGDSVSFSFPVNITAGDNCIVVPVNWLSFSAVLQNGKIMLNWSVASEVNNKEFVIERSTDGIHWLEIFAVASKGNGSLQNNYSAADPVPVTGINFYRIKQVDIDGRFTYSVTSGVRFAKSNASFIIYPNPLHTMVNYELQGAGNAVKVDLELSAVDGKLLKQFHVRGPRGSFSVQDFPAGIYVLTVRSNTGMVENKKLVIQK